MTLLLGIWASPDVASIGIALRDAYIHVKLEARLQPSRAQVPKGRPLANLRGPQIGI
jgi:hypothetical protein